MSSTAKRAERRKSKQLAHADAIGILRFAVLEGCGAIPQMILYHAQAYLRDPIEYAKERKERRTCSVASQFFEREDVKNAPRFKPGERVKFKDPKYRGNGRPGTPDYINPRREYVVSTVEEVPDDSDVCGDEQSTLSSVGHTQWITLAGHEQYKTPELRKLFADTTRSFSGAYFQHAN